MVETVSAREGERARRLDCLGRGFWILLRLCRRSVSRLDLSRRERGKKREEGRKGLALGTGHHGQAGFRTAAHSDGEEIE
jgi:hypothetical protein